MRPMIHQKGCASMISLTHTRIPRRSEYHRCVLTGASLSHPQIHSCWGNPQTRSTEIWQPALLLRPSVFHAWKMPKPPSPAYIYLIWFSGAHHTFVHDLKLIFMFKASKRSAESASYLSQHRVQVRD